jgi:4-hydroxybenzoate polyprenyltransferase
MAETQFIRLTQRSIWAPVLVRRRPVNRLLAWLRLLRLPAVLTALTDVVAGAVVGTVPFGRYPELLPLLLLLAASACLYTGGMVLNDVLDYPEDLQERPERPLPSGAVSAKAALGAALLLLAGGLLLAAASGCGLAFYVALVIALLVVLYNGFAKRSRFFGPLVLSACRALNLLLGATLSTALILGWGLEYVLAPALALGAYTFVLSLAAAHEASPNHARVARWTALGFAVVLALTAVLVPPASFDLGTVGSRLILAGLLLVLLVRCFITAQAQPAILLRLYGRPVRALVGTALYGLPALDAAFVLAWWRGAISLPHVWLLGALSLLMLLTILPLSLLRRSIEVT